MDWLIKWVIVKYAFQLAYLCCCQLLIDSIIAAIVFVTPTTTHPNTLWNYNSELHHLHIITIFFLHLFHIYIQQLLYSFLFTYNFMLQAAVYYFMRVCVELFQFIIITITTRSKHIYYLCFAAIEDASLYISNRLKYILLSQL